MKRYGHSYLMLLAMWLLNSCVCENCEDYVPLCDEFGLENRELGEIVLHPYTYVDQNRSDLTSDTTTRRDFGINLDFFYRNTIIKSNDSPECMEIVYLETVEAIQVLLHVPGDLDSVDYSDAFRHQSRLISGLGPFNSNDNWINLAIDLVAYEQLPDSAIFIAKLILDTDVHVYQSMDTLYFID